MAFTAIGALVAGEAVTTTVVIAAVAEAGVALSVVGAVTGNEKLMKVGGVLGLAAGVGGLVNGAISGAAGAAAVESVGSVGAEGIGSVADIASDAGLSEVANTGASSIATEGLNSAASSVADPSAFSQLDSLPGPAADSMMEQGQGIIGGAQTVEPSQLSNATGAATPEITDIGTPMSPNAPASPSGPADISAPTTPADSFSPGADSAQFSQMDASGLPAKETSDSFFKAPLDWMKKNPDLLKLGSNVISGIGKAYDSNRAFSLKEQELAMHQQLAANGRSVPVSSIKFNQASQVNNPYKPTGIINNAKG